MLKILVGVLAVIGMLATLGVVAVIVLGDRVANYLEVKANEIKAQTEAIREEKAQRRAKEASSNDEE